MDKYSQRNCRKNGMTLLKTSGRRLLVKRYGYSRWKELKTYANALYCYRAAIELTRTNPKYVKL